MHRLDGGGAATDTEFQQFLQRIPLQDSPPMAPDWLRWEMRERDEVLRRAAITEGTVVLEVGSGPHAIATVPLAYRAGPVGRILAVERGRWGQFRTVVAASGLGPRIWPVTGDARRLPLNDDAVSLAVCIHGIRSLQGEANIVRVVRELLRVAPRVVLAESLPIARTDAQRAHLAMYDLREEMLSATTGRYDDLHYLPIERLAALVESAGGSVESIEVLNVDLPHFLAYFPRTLVEAIPAGARRDDLLRRWDEAEGLRIQYGEDHPPVGIVAGKRR